jgi:hypothetical protein
MHPEANPLTHSTRARVKGRTLMVMGAHDGGTIKR